MAIKYHGRLRTWYNVNKKRKGKGVDVMATIKPIQATPELSGKDAANVLAQVNTKPTDKAMKKNSLLRGILANVRKI